MKVPNVAEESTAFNISFWLGFSLVKSKMNPILLSDFLLSLYFAEGKEQSQVSFPPFSS